MPQQDRIVRNRPTFRGGFRLTACRHPGCERLSIRQDARTLFEWRGETARHLIDALGETPTGATTARLLSKPDVREIALKAAAAEFRRRRPPQNERSPTEFEAGIRLARRLEELGVALRRAEATVAEVLFRYPGVHLREGVAVDLVKLERPLVSEQQVRDALDALVDAKVCQRIRVDELNFYDTDITPHLHVYCPTTRELRDAPSDGILRLPQ